MLRSIKTTLAYAKIELLRALRDPITTIVLFGIPVLLVLVFGTITGRGDDVSVRVAVINNSSEQFAGEFEEALTKVKPFQLPDEKLTLDQARQQMDDDSLDGIIELPKDFGALQAGAPSGAVKLYYDQSDAQTGDIVAGIMRSVVEDTNRSLTPAPTPITIERTPINVAQASAFDGIFAMFTAMATMMVGIFAVGSVFPTAKKTGALRRLRATPIKAREIILGTTGCYLIIGLIGVTLLTVLALTLFNLDMRGDWLSYAAFIVFSIFVMLGFGLAIGGIAKNTTQSDVWAQIVFLASLAFSGVWFPRALMPEFLQGITSYMPLSPIIDGISAIVTEGASFLALGPELAILAGWGVLVYFVGIKLFRWE